MKKWLLPVGLALTGLVFIWQWQKSTKPKDETPKQQPIAQGAFSAAFEDSTLAALTHYYELSEGFVDWDTATIRREGEATKTFLSRIPSAEIDKDTTGIGATLKDYLATMQTELDGMLNAPVLEEKRRHFQSVSTQLFDFLRTAKFSKEAVYFQECPMAFNDSEAAQWLSASSAIRNPYLGEHHPKYKKGMLNCGDVKDSLLVTRTPAVQ